MLGSLVAIDINTELLGVSCKIVSEICSRIIDSAFSLSVIFTIKYQSFHYFIKLLKAAFATSDGDTADCVEELTLPEIRNCGVSDSKR